MRSRRSFLRGFMAGGGVVAATGDLALRAQSPVRRIQTTLDLYPPEPREWEGLQGWNTPDYSNVGSAASASGRAMYFHLGLAPIVSARWLVIWNPKGSPLSGLRLETFWTTQPMVPVEITGDPRNSPIDSAADVTLALQRLQQQGQAVYFFQKMRGAPVVFASTLELVWDVS